MATTSYTIGCLTDPEDVFRNSVFWNPGASTAEYLMNVTHTLRIGSATFPVGPVVKAVPIGRVDPGELRIGALQRESFRLRQGRKIEIRGVAQPPVATVVVLDGPVDDVAALDGCVVAKGYRLAVRSEGGGGRIVTVLSATSGAPCAIIRAGVTEIRWADRVASDLL